MASFASPHSGISLRLAEGQSFGDFTEPKAIVKEPNTEVAKQPRTNGIPFEVRRQAEGEADITETTAVAALLGDDEQSESLLNLYYFPHHDLIPCKLIYLPLDLLWLDSIYLLTSTTAFGLTAALLGDDDRRESHTRPTHF